MKYIIALLFLSTITLAVPVSIDLNLVHQENTAGASPIIYEPGPVIDEIYVTPTNTPTNTPTDTDTLILYDTNSDANSDINSVINDNPPSSFVIEHNQHNQQNKEYVPNKLFPNAPLF